MQTWLIESDMSYILPVKPYKPVQNFVQYHHFAIPHMYTYLKNDGLWSLKRVLVSHSFSFPLYSFV